jgi:hypothetical protein
MVNQLIKEGTVDVNTTSMKLLVGPRVRELDIHFGTLGSATSRKVEPLLRTPCIIHIYYILHNHKLGVRLSKWPAEIQTVTVSQ